MKTVEKECSIEFEEKKSRFIGYIKPIQSKNEAEEFISYIKGKHVDAVHNCSAYKVIEDGQEYYKVDDDGEPSGTAGKPMGEIFNVLGVDNLVVVATRYFGGIKLGAGGLIRAYAKTAKLAVGEAGIVDYIEKKNFVIDFPYGIVTEVDKMLTLDGVKVFSREYGERVTYRLEAPEQLKNELSELKDVIVI